MSATTRKGNTTMSIRDLSYDRRVERGGTVTFRAQTATSDHNGDNRLEVGQVYTGTVLSESNAGFAGIVMTVEINGGRYVGISTGTIEAKHFTRTTVERDDLEHVGPCDDCGRPLDYDYNTDRFVHAEEPATGCWLHAGIEEG